MEDFKVINGKKYRKGYTTGSCAAGAAKAAVMMLVTGKVIETVDIDTPAGKRLTLPVSDAVVKAEASECSVIKDGGDDPDITTGLKIFASVRRYEGSGIVIKAGEGIGTATLPGLKVKPGQPAINPVPIKMILSEVNSVLPEGYGVEIIFSVPGGEEAAKKTYNPRLGIVGGISILGTTGIVEPMSEEAWKDALALELDILAAKGKKRAVFVFGNYGETFAIESLGVARENIVIISNFLGFMLDKAVEGNFSEILLVGHMGKLIKVAVGIFHTHSRVADARMEALAAYVALEGAATSVVTEIYGCRTTEAAAEIIGLNGLEEVYERIVANASRRCCEYTFDRIRVGTVLFNAENNLLAMDEGAKDMLEDLRVDL